MSAMGSAFGTSGSLLRFPFTRLSDRQALTRILIDGIVLALCLASVLVAIHFRKVGSDFNNDDVSYFERARTLVQTGTDGFNGRLETTQPPGLPLILAMGCYLRACNYGAVLRLMAMFGAVGLALTYVLLRRGIGRAGAAVICVLVMASPLYASMATEWLATTLPFLTVLTATLLSARKLDEAPASRPQLFWAGILAVLTAASILISTAAVILIIAILLKLAFTCLSDRRVALVQLKRFSAALLLGIAVQGYWMHRKPAPLEWPIPGYPRPYLEQLAVKNGHNPELGYATGRDIAVRIATNLRDETLLFDQQFSGHWIDAKWWSIAIAGPVLMILVGWTAALWETGGQSLEAWFFGGYQSICLLWPWNMDVRYFLPVAPLACFFAWKGIAASVSAARRRPGLVGLAWGGSSAVLGAGCIVALWKGAAARASFFGSGVQTKVSLMVWFLSGLAAVFLAMRSSRSLMPGDLRRFPPFPSKIMDWSWRAAAGLAVAAVLVGSLARDLDIKRDNLNPESGVNRATPDVVAAKWIYSNTPSNVVVMARHVPITYYYANRRIVWFPPSSNADLLMEGIGRHKVDYVVAASRKTNYYFPTDDESMAALLARYPSRFQLVAQPGAARIFRVVER